MTEQELHEKANELAKQVVPEFSYQSFTALSLESKLVGLATLAHVSGDDKTRDAVLKLAA